MFDLVIRGGEAIDGTRAPRRATDMGISDGRIALIGQIAGSGERDADARGRVLPPGFIDIHPHLDAMSRRYQTELQP